MAKKMKKAKPHRRSSGQAKKPSRPADENSEVMHKTKIRVIGVGGGGGSIVSEIAPHIKKADFTVANTDMQALKEIGKKVRTFQFGQNSTHGLGCGMDPKIGQKAARDAKEKVANLFKGVDLAILVSSLGGGTGSGAVPEFAKIAKELGIMTFGIFTLPFKFEGVKKAQIARSSLEKITPNLNAFSVIPNENIFQLINKDTPIMEAFSVINRRLSDNIRGLIEIIYLPGIVNIDFADIRTILDGKGKLAYLNSAIGDGENRAEEALKDLLNSPLNEYDIDGAEKIVFDITASKELRMQEVEMISRTISDFNRRAKIIFGVSQDNNYEGKLRITLLAVGCGKEPEKVAKDPEDKPKPKPNAESAPEIKPAPKTLPIGKRAKKKNQPGNKKKIAKAKQPNQKIKKESLPQKVKVISAEKKSADSKPFGRKNALDLKKEAEDVENELLEEEKKWEVPAFLRRQENQ
ncbi:MAG: cell division protein FtsZ [Candidatus Nealsonbacteria bacterium]|nr:cell division protein FtsZ [Candidatus Nealsonbacteria bacterium]